MGKVRSSFGSFDWSFGTAFGAPIVLAVFVWRFPGRGRGQVIRVLSSSRFINHFKKIVDVAGRWWRFACSGSAQPRTVSGGEESQRAIVWLQWSLLNRWQQTSFRVAMQHPFFFLMYSLTSKYKSPGVCLSWLCSWSNKDLKSLICFLIPIRFSLTN